MNTQERIRNVRKSALALSLMSDSERNAILKLIADAISSSADRLKSANEEDLRAAAEKNTAPALVHRLVFDDQKIEASVRSLISVMELPCPIGKVLTRRELDEELILEKVTYPLGVIGMVFEARPNVAFDVFSLCFKSGNACVLKGGRDADDSNRAIVSLIHGILRDFDVDPNVVALLPATHEATAEMLNAVGYVDVCIPRGGRKLIDFVRDNAKVPVIETGAGVVHAYFDEFGNLEMGKRIIDNAKTRRVSVCNALDCLIIHRSRLDELPALLEPVIKKNVEIVYDDFGTEFMDYKMAVKVVDSIDEAIEHIAAYGSGHSECIITDNKDNATKFQQLVDAACVYVNAPTSFTDGAQFGLGAEIGISTQKLGPRGPMGLEEITTYKWLIEGEGQIRN